MGEGRERKDSQLERRVDSCCCVNPVDERRTSGLLEEASVECGVEEVRVRRSILVVHKRW